MGCITSHFVISKGEFIYVQQTIMKIMLCLQILCITCRDRLWKGKRV